MRNKWHELESKDYFVSFEQAKKLEQLGFEEKCLFHYYKDGTFHSNSYDAYDDDGETIYVSKLLETNNRYKKNNKYYDDYVDAPFIFQAQYYLNENFGIFIELVPDKDRLFTFSYRLLNYDVFNTTVDNRMKVYYDSSENEKDKNYTMFQALMAGIDKALDILLTESSNKPQEIEKVKIPKYESLMFNGIGIKNVIDFVGEDNIRFNDFDNQNYTLNIILKEPSGEEAYALCKPGDYIIKKDDVVIDVCSPEKYNETYMLKER